MRAHLQHTIDKAALLVVLRWALYLGPLNA